MPGGVVNACAREERRRRVAASAVPWLVPWACLVFLLFFLSRGVCVRVFIVVWVYYILRTMVPL